MTFCLATQFFLCSSSFVFTIQAALSTSDSQEEILSSHEINYTPLNSQKQEIDRSINDNSTVTKTTMSSPSSEAINTPNQTRRFPPDIRYFETLANLSHQASDNIRSGHETMSSERSPNLLNILTPSMQNQNFQKPPSSPPSFQVHLPQFKPTTPQYYDPYYGSETKRNGGVNGVALGLGIGIPLSVILTGFFIGGFFWYRRRRRQTRNGLPLPFPGKKNNNDYEAQLDSPAYSIHDPWILERHFLEIDYSKKLGSGAFCNVFKGKIIGEAPVSQIHPGVRTQQFRDFPVAVKMLPSFADDMARSDFMQEINFMKSLAYHPHLVSMLGYVPDKKSPFLLVELCERGDLLHLIRNRKNEIINGPSFNLDGLKIKDLLMFSWQISNGLEYLNSLGCIHRDIAARNILVDGTNTCKIGDFGLCRLTDSLLYTARGGRVPLKWMAPESLQSFEYSVKSDVWSYGVLLWELFSLGEVPYADIQTSDLLNYHKSEKRLQKPVHCPEEMYEIMKETWKSNAEERPSFTKICTILAEILENVTESYGYLIPTSKRDITLNGEQCDNV